MEIVERPSPNHDARADGAGVDMLVLHYTGMKTAEAALARLCDPQAKVSAHYTIDRDGRIFRHVPEERRAWHAGISYWAGEKNVNATSIGIELVNPGHEFGYEPFPDEQIGALIDLGCDIVARHRIAPQRVLGHSDVAPARKDDPGELFPWSELADYGIGVWPFARSSVSPSGGDIKLREVLFSGRGTEVKLASRPGEVESLLDVETRDLFVKNLRAYGYGVSPDVEVALEKVVAAFQRHWRPAKIDGIVDEETAYRLGVLLDALS